MNIRAALLDIAGVLHEGGVPLSGALDAVRDLLDQDVPLRFVTNTSRRTRAATVAQLTEMGFPVAGEQVFTAPLAARSYLEQHGLRPFLVIHPQLSEDFQDMNCRNPNAVFVADAAEYFAYPLLDEAFRLLVEGAPLVAVGRNRYFRDQAGLHLDAGPFVAALEFASGQTAVVAGKPAPAFFQAVLRDLGVSAEEAVMIGDDVEADVLGAADCGLHAVLVQTGKYRPGDEKRLSDPRCRVARDLAHAVAAL